MRRQADQHTGGLQNCAQHMDVSYQHGTGLGVREGRTWRFWAHEETLFPITFGFRHFTVFTYTLFLFLSGSQMAQHPRLQQQVLLRSSWKNGYRYHALRPSASTSLLLKKKKTYCTGVSYRPSRTFLRSSFCIFFAWLTLRRGSLSISS